MPHVRRPLLLAVLLSLALVVPALGAELYQVSTIEALSAGGYAGERPFADLARHGDFGLGTLTDLDGEMVALDGVFYQVKSDGAVHVVPPTATTPFAEVVSFKGSLDLGQVDGLDLAGLQAALTARLPEPSRFYAARVEATFVAVTARSVPAQQQPWPSLAEAITHQAVFPLKDIRGTLVGIYAPPSVPGLAPTGWHFHFLSEDRTRGGHVLGLTIDHGTARADGVDVMTVVFPGQPLPRRAVAAPAPGTE
jgi:acetolactate decarboxylase